MTGAVKEARGQLSEAVDHYRADLGLMERLVTESFQNMMDARAE